MFNVDLVKPTDQISDEVNSICAAIPIEGTNETWKSKYGSVAWSGRLVTARSADGKLIGFGTFSRTFYMFLGVAPEFRRQGVAKAITDRIIKEAGGKINLTCRQNRTAYLFYRNAYNIQSERNVGEYENGDPMVALTITSRS